MIIAFAADHAGFPLRDAVVDAIRAAGHTPLDVGTPAPVPGDDYPDVAVTLAAAITDARADRGVLACGSGVGASIAANKIHGIRAALCHDTFSAHQGVEDDDMNVLCLGARVVGPSLAAELVRTFLGANFSGLERHARRVAKVRHLDER